LGLVRTTPARSRESSRSPPREVRGADRAAVLAWRAPLFFKDGGVFAVFFVIFFDVDAWDDAFGRLECDPLRAKVHVPVKANPIQARRANVFIPFKT
jgi:hypothetical protein